MSSARSAMLLARVARLAVFVLLAQLATSSGLVQVGTANADGITYVYDEAGRLVGVIDAAGESAAYAYDPAGNLLSITRRSASQVSILEFTPNGGPIGTVVTIFGTTFSATPAQNIVKFNGITASVTSATTTQLVATVPSSATTGTITVTSPAGTATSAAVFIVGGSGTAPPTIASFSPTKVVAGTAVTINGTGFQASGPSNQVRMNQSQAQVSSATSSMLVSTLPSQTSSGRIRVGTPNGTATSAGDLFVVPPGFALADLLPTDRMSIGGAAVTLAITKSSKIGIAVFDGTGGQQTTLAMTNVTIPRSLVWVYDPFGADVTHGSVTAAGATWVLTLPIPGTYSVLVDPVGSDKGNMTLRVF